MATRIVEGLVIMKWTFRLFFRRDVGAFVFFSDEVAGSRFCVRGLEGKEPNRSTPSSGGYGGALIGLWWIGSCVKLFHQQLISSAWLNVECIIWRNASRAMPGMLICPVFDYTFLNVINFMWSRFCPNNNEVHIYKVSASPDTVWERVYILEKNDQLVRASIEHQSAIKLLRAPITETRN